MKSIIRKILKKLSFVFSRLPFVNRRRLRGAKLSLNGALLVHCKIDCKGKGNEITFAKGVMIKNTLILIRGNNNKVCVGENSVIVNGELWIEDDNNLISIGESTKLCGKAHLACIEGTAIRIGDGCLFSSDLVFRTGDSHSVLDSEGKRINPSADIVVGDKVWIGHRAMVTKGAKIPANSVVGTGAIVTKAFEEQGVALAGVPAKVIKTNIGWCSKRI